MTSKLLLSEPNLKTVDTTGTNSLIISPGCQPAGRGAAPSGAAPAFMPLRCFPSDVD